MKYKILLISIVALICFNPAQASAHTERERLMRQIEIIKYEISLLQMLISNMKMQREIVSPSYLAVDLNDNSVLLEKNSSQIRSIASITKLMTAIIAAENINPDKKVILTEEMLQPWGHTPVLFSGLIISAEDLFKASLIQSTNDASESLAYILGKEEFIGLMNRKAKEMGMENTVFYDSHGLSPANKSTARDLAKLMSYIHNNHPEILTVTKNNNFWLPDPGGRLLKFRNVNNFYPLSGFVGGKTGYLPEAGQTMASIFKINGKPVAVIVLQSDNRQADIFTILRMID